MTAPSEPSPPPEIPADLAAEAARKRRRRALALLVLILFLLPTALQIELRSGGRLASLRVLGPVDGAGGSGGRGVGRGRRVALASAKPAGANYGAVREAPPSELEPRAGANPVIEAQDQQPLLAAPDSAFTLPPAPGAPAPTPTDLSLPTGFPSPEGGFPTTLVSSPVTSNPGTPGGPTPPPVINPSNPGNPTNPTNPSNPSNPSSPGNPTDPGNPTNPGGPPVITPTNPDPGGPVVTPPDSGGPGGPGDPGGPGTPGGPGGPGAVPEAATWIEMILGFGLAGVALRRRRQPPTALRARSSALTAVVRLG